MILSIFSFPIVYAVFKINNPIIRPIIGSIIGYPLFDAKTPTKIAIDEKMSTFGDFHLPQ